jgi:UDP-glucose 4-epimerase
MLNHTRRGLYQGTHRKCLLCRWKKDVVIYNSLYCSLESCIDHLRKKYGIEIPLIVADIGDTVKFEGVLTNIAPYGVIQTVALKAASESGTVVTLTTSKQLKLVSGITSRGCYT